MDNFTRAFEHNFYLQREWADFCSVTTKIPIQKQDIGNKAIYILKNKNISISNYPQSFCVEMMKKKISYSSVTPEINKKSNRPSFIEYSIFHKTTYDEALKNYRTSFFHGLREGKKFPHQVKIFRQPNDWLIKEIYGIYNDQMKRLNSFVFPLSFFEEFFKCPSSLLFTIEYDGRIIAYFCCFQYKDNIYSSIGGGNPRYFPYKCSNKLYDELIKYACQNNLNIHMGIGQYGSGYQKFKENAGAINYRMLRFPDYEKLLKLLFPLTTFRITGKILGLASKFFPRLIIYLLMPFT